jgi:hypothetical protein
MIHVLLNHPFSHIDSPHFQTAWWLTYPSEKSWSSSVGMMMIPNWMESHKKCSKPPISKIQYPQFPSDFPLDFPVDFRDHKPSARTGRSGVNFSLATRDQWQSHDHGPCPCHGLAGENGTRKPPWIALETPVVSWKFQPINQPIDIWVYPVLIHTP